MSLRVTISLAVMFVFVAMHPCCASTVITSIDPTQMQAKITANTDQPGCKVRASRGIVLTSNVPDLLDNGDTDARAGSVVNGSQHIFVLGTRRGNDALAADATYIVGLTCGSDPEISRTFKTRPIPMGNMAPDSVPFNAARFGNMDYPVIDWNDGTKSYVDPLSGAEYWRLTGPGMIAPAVSSSLYSTTVQTPVDLSGSGWSNLSNLTSGKPGSTTFAIASGSGANKIFLPIDPSIAYWRVAGWTPQQSIDDVLLNVYCGSASSADQTITVQLSANSGQTLLGVPVTTSTCPAASPANIGTYPQAKVNVTLKGWGFSDIPRHDLVSPTGGTVSVAGNIVTLTSLTYASNYFQTSWPAGSLIQINGTYYHIASVQSAKQLALVESPGTLTNVPYKSAVFGVVLTKNGTGSIKISLGVDVYTSSVPTNCCNADVGSQNRAPVSVSKSADGTVTFNPPLAGYLSYVSDFGGASSILLWIPYNSDGSPRTEIRLLSLAAKPNVNSPSLHTNGDKFQYGVGLNISGGTVFDNVDGKSFYGLGADKVHFFRATYNESLPGCAGYIAYHPYPSAGDYPVNGAAQADDCFDYFNLTPSSQTPPMDLVSQITRGYQTGLNSLGQSIGPAHRGFDLGWLGLSSGITDGGYFTVSLSNRGEHLSILASFDTQTGVLRTIKNMWGGDGDTEARWGGIHTIALSAGTWRWGSMNPLANNTGEPGKIVFNSSFDLPVIKIDRASYGAPPAWDSTTTALGDSEAYTCPDASVIPARYASLAGTKNCVQVKVSSPPCNAAPNATYVFPNGKTEAQEFPCATPGFGVADSTRSKLMDMRPGDWMWEQRTGPLNERFIVFAITYNGTNDIDIWLCRWGVTNYLKPLFGYVDDRVPPYNVRPNGWFLSMAPTMSAGPAAQAIDISAGASAKFLLDNPVRAACHGVVGPGSAPGLYTYAEPCNPPNYIGQVDMTPQDLLFKPLTAVMGASYPGFAGSTAGIQFDYIQDYNNQSYTFGASNPPFELDMRHINPAYGSGPEYLGSTLGGSRTMTVVPGTTKTYQIQDTTSSGPADPKRLPYHFWAGHHLLNDISSPATGNTADLADFNACRVYSPGECFAASAVGNLYVTVPHAYVDPYCRTNQYTLAAPCAIQLMPYSGENIQFRTDISDSTGLTTRRLGYLHGFPGLKYQFSNCRATPDASFEWCVIDHVDGKRSEWFAIRIAPLPKADGENRTTFIPVKIPVKGQAGAVSVRARFGYAENGPGFHCTKYAQDCSTEIPSAKPSDPYSFMNESVTRQPLVVGSSATITIPALAGRVLYYTIDFLDSSGNVVSSTPTAVIAVY
jgi:hypothetical protein